MAVAGKDFRAALAEDYSQIGDALLYQKLQSLFLKIKNCDPKEAGSGTVAGGLTTDEGKRLFSEFKFHKKKGNVQNFGIKTENGRIAVYHGQGKRCEIVVLEIQIDLSKGSFRAFQHVLDAFLSEGSFIIKKRFKTKKHYCTFMLLKVEGIVKQGIVPGA